MKTKRETTEALNILFFFFFLRDDDIERFFPSQNFMNLYRKPHECNVMSFINFTVSVLPVQFM